MHPLKLPSMRLDADCPRIGNKQLVSKANCNSIQCLVN